MIQANNNNISLNRLSRHIFVPVTVHPLNSPRLLWLNVRYFLSQSIDVSDPDVFAETQQWLLDNYAVMTSEVAPSNKIRSDTRTIFADRYGGSGGASHGGSGRCASDGLRGFNAKGIGRTPLVPTGLKDLQHTHGRLLLSEAIREAIASEIADAELPYGAIPIVAIIDTDVSFKSENGDVDRCAIVVRPDFVRPAHFERSIFFGPGGTTQSDQYIDAQRVKEAVATVTTPSALIGECSLSLEAMFLRFAEQMGATRALRLWQSRLLSSNLSIDGALVDFGAFRAVANWRKATGLSGESFGEEARHFSIAVESLCFYFRKFAPADFPVPTTKELMSKINSTIEKAFIQTSLQGMGITNEKAERVGSAISGYYRAQQAQITEVDDRNDLRRPWIFDLLAGRPRQFHATPREQEAENALLDVLIDGVTSDNANRCSRAAYRWFKPRPRLFFNLAVKGVAGVVRRLTGIENVDQAQVGRYISAQICQNRRHWPGRPLTEITAQATTQGSSLLKGRHRETGREGIWLEGPIVCSVGHLFNSRVPYETLEKIPNIPNSGGIFLPAETIERTENAVKFAGQLLRLPEPIVNYDGGAK